MRKQMKASFNGEIHEIPGIAIDNFNDTGKRAYFLSHCHGDHIVGLKFLHSRLDPTVFIYMSEISAAIVKTDIDKNLESFIKPLKLGATTITIPGDKDNNVQDLYVAVTLIPAGHCFGSVMFLFETPLKKVLYTGDFRITENSVSKMAQLHGEDGKPIKLDTLYVDTTFQDEKYETFPKRSDIMDGVYQEIRAWLKRSDKHMVALVPSARYGYESILNKIYKQMSMKVYVDGNWSLYSQFLDILPGVTNKRGTTRIHLCSNIKKYCSTCPGDIKHEYLFLHFSAMRWRNFQPEDMTIDKRNDNHIHVCFVTHCSRSELLYFVEYLSPRKVVGFSEEYVGKKSSSVTCSSKRGAELPDSGTLMKIPKNMA